MLYTSDGRDVEMSVASTKAFYCQVVAGYLLALHMAQLAGAIDDVEDCRNDPEAASGQGSRGTRAASESEQREPLPHESVRLHDLFEPQRGFRVVVQLAT